MIINHIPDKLRIVFFGTPEFAIPSLEALLSNGYEPLLVVTNPDEPAGRKQIITSPPAQIYAKRHHIPIFQPAHLAQEFINIPDADLFIIVAFGSMIPQALIDKPRYGALNIHPSLLPRWRGPSPIQSAILHGDVKTGVTLIQIDKLMDHGPILMQENFSLTEKKWVFPQLHDALANLGAKMLINVLPQWIDGTLIATPQDDMRVSYCKLLKKDDGRITWSRSADEIERMIRAYTPWPSAWTLWPGRDKIYRIRIDEANVISDECSVGSPGYVWQTNSASLLIKTGKGTLDVQKITIEGKTTLDAYSFLHGNPELMGATFV